MSSNVLTGLDHERLFAHLSAALPEVRHYPEASPAALEGELSCHYGVRPAEVMATNGATEAIYLMAQAFRGAHSAIMMPTFAEYADAARLHGHKVTPLYSLPCGKLPKDVDMMWICNPNNPTGSVWPKEALLEVIEKNQHVLFVLDQSYEHFTQEPLFSIAEAIEIPNVLLLHSMTKHFCVPGLRIGFITAHEALLERIRAVRMPWSMNAMALSAGSYLLSHEKDYAFDLKALLAECSRVTEALEKTRLVEVYPSQSHILLCRLRMGKALALKDYLVQEHGILIRYAGNFHGLDETHFRIAVQRRREDNDLFMKALTEYFAL